MGLLRQVAGGALKGAGEGMIAGGKAIREAKREEIRNAALDARQQTNITARAEEGVLNRASSEKIELARIGQDEKKEEATAAWRLKQGEWQHQRATADDLYKQTKTAGDIAYRKATVERQKVLDEARISWENATLAHREKLDLWRKEDRDDTKENRAEDKRLSQNAKTALTNYRVLTLAETTRHNKATEGKGDKLTKKDYHKIVMDVVDKKLDEWGKPTIVDKKEYDRLMKAVQAGGTMAKPTAEERLRDNPDQAKEYIKLFGQEQYDKVIEGFLSEIDELGMEFD